MENFPSSPGPVGEGAARQEVSGPAIFLMVVGGLSVANTLFNVVKLLTAGRTPVVLPPELLNNPDMAEYLPLIEKLIEFSTGPLAWLFTLLGLGLAVLILVGGLKMKNLENRSLAMASAIIALIPCFSCCCLLGMPAGIWALIVLSKPEVKAAFRS